MDDPAFVNQRKGGRHWEFRLPRERRWGLASERPAIAGVVNVTPDSFSDGGQYSSPAAAVEWGLRLLEEGADLLDIGGESTRPGSLPVPSDEQVRRVLPVLRGLRAVTESPLSVDTSSPEVAAEALAAGADIINDVNACRAPGWRDLLGGCEAPIVLMHMQGSPRDMQKNPTYPEGIVAEVRRFFEERIAAVSSWGVDQSRIVLDPGIGFGKCLQHNLELIRNIEQLRVSDRPVMIGLSRKGFIGKILDLPVAERLEGSLATAVLGMIKGAQILRVHDVKETYRSVKIASEILKVQNE